VARKGQKRAPRELGTAGKGLWRVVTENFELEPHHLVVLEQAACALDRATTCREAIARDGQTIVDRWGQVKPHPLLAAERDARSSFVRCLSALGLDVIPAGPNGRPPGSGR